MRPFQFTKLVQSVKNAKEKTMLRFLAFMLALSLPAGIMVYMSPRTQRPVPSVISLPITSEQDAGISATASDIVDGVEVTWDFLNQNIRVLNNNGTRASIRFHASETYQLEPYQTLILDGDLPIKAEYLYQVSVRVDQHSLVYRTYRLVR